MLRGRVWPQHHDLHLPALHHSHRNIIHQTAQWSAVCGCVSASTQSAPSLNRTSRPESDAQQLCVCVCLCTLGEQCWFYIRIAENVRNKEKKTRCDLALQLLYLCIPEHSMHSRMPRLMEAQRGSAWPQSQHCSFPGRHWMRCRMVSPRTLRSRGSLAESMLLVDGEAVLSRCFTSRTHKRHVSITNSRAFCRHNLSQSQLCLDLDVVGVWTLSVGRGDAGLHRLDPRLSQLLGLSLKHTAPVK